MVPYICHSQIYRSATSTACNLPRAICRYSGFGFENSCSHLYVRDGEVLLSTCFRGLLAGCFVACPCLHAPHPCIQLGIYRLLNRSPLNGCLQREDHQDVCSSELFATKELSTARR